MNEIRRPSGEVIARYADGVSFSWPNGMAPDGEIVFFHSEDDGETWKEYLRGKYVFDVQLTQKFVPAGVSE